MAMPTVLTIDDDRLVRNIISRALQDEYEVLSAANGTEGIVFATGQQPDVVLLDVEMPDMNGFEVCEKLKSNAETKDIPIIFLSGSGSLRSRMQGYEAGAADFMVKPFENSELKAKISVLANFSDEHDNLNEQVSQASSAAFTAMQSSSEMGNAIQYIEASHEAKTLDQLAASFLAVTRKFELNCGLLFMTKTEKLFYTCSGKEMPPLEKNLMIGLLEKNQRFIDFGCRTQICYSHVALLIKNMPIEDPGTYGRLKDFFPAMLGATDEKVQSLLTEQALLAQSTEFTSTFSIVGATLSDVGSRLERNQEEVVGLLQSMLGDLEDNIPMMGLDDDQETYLLTRIDSTINKAEVIVDDGASTAASFQGISRLLEHLAEQQQKLMNELAIDPDEDKAAESTVKVEEDSDDIELF